MQFESASFTITETIQFYSQKIKEMFWRQVRFLRAKRQSPLEVFERLTFSKNSHKLFPMLKHSVLSAEISTVICEKCNRGV